MLRPERADATSWLSRLGMLCQQAIERWASAMRARDIVTVSARAVPVTPVAVLPGRVYAPGQRPAWAG
jgi:hypothetical protein